MISYYTIYILLCVILYIIIHMFYTILYYTILYYTILYYTMKYYVSYVSPDLPGPDARTWLHPQWLCTLYGPVPQ